MATASTPFFEGDISIIPIRLCIEVAASPAFLICVIGEICGSISIRIKERAPGISY